MKYLLVPVIVLLGLVAVSKITVPMMRAYDASLPRYNFYSDEAWGNCASMRQEAKAHGFDAWSCHEPGSVGPG